MAATRHCRAVELTSLFPEALGSLPQGWFATWGTGDDVDQAFDRAMDRALHAWGEQVVPSLDPAHLVVVDPEVPLTLAGAYRLAHERLANDGVQGVAVRFYERRSFRNKPVRVSVTDESVELPPVGPLSSWDGRLAELLVEGTREVLDAQDFGPFELDTVELVRRNVRSRAQAQRVVGKSRKQFVVLEGDRIVARFDAQKDARAHAMALARGDSRDEATWHLAALVGRDTEDGWRPLVDVLRRRRAHKGVFKVVACQPRENPGRPGGWVFACRTDVDGTAAGGPVDVVEDTPADALAGAAADAPAGAPADGQADEQ